jgi:mannose-6-phosphate isomerase-like protein (cupin superfamily)
MIERVEFNGVESAIILRSGFHEPGIHFFTPGDFSQQLGYMRHPAGHVIQPHVHNPVTRAVHFTHEVLFLRRGRLRVDFYTDRGAYLESRELGAGDVILLAAGGHGFEALEEIEMIEVKQGPYVGEADKTLFPGVTATEVRTANACNSAAKKTKNRS